VGADEIPDCVEDARWVDLIWIVMGGVSGLAPDDVAGFVLDLLAKAIPRRPKLIFDGGDGPVLGDPGLVLDCVADCLSKAVTDEDVSELTDQVPRIDGVALVPALAAVPVKFVAGVVIQAPHADYERIQQCI